MNDLLSLYSLFDKKFYRIPKYQRGYAWDESQLEDFYLDLISLNGDIKHYTGLLSTKPVSSQTIFPNDEAYGLTRLGYTLYELVDGQQRISTSLILIFCMVKRALELGLSSLSYDGKTMSIEDIKSHYLYWDRLEEDGVIYFKLLHSEDAYMESYFRGAILEQENHLSYENSYYTSNLSRAKKYFEEKLKGLTADKLGEYFFHLTDSFLFNFQELQHFDEYVAFETMNNRGKKLSNLEILKNRLMYLTGLFPEDKLSKVKAENMRLDIAKCWGEIYKQLGQEPSLKLNDDDFLHDHWMLSPEFTYLRNGVPYSDILLRERFNPSNIANLNLGDLSSYALSLSKYSRYWFYTFYPGACESIKGDEAAVQWISKLNRLGMAYFRPLIAVSLCKEKDPKVLSNLFAIVERLVFCFFRLAGWQSSYKTSEIINLTKALVADRKSVKQIAAELEAMFEKDKSNVVRDFVKKSARRFDNNGAGFYYWGSLRYFLYEYERSFKTDDADRSPSWESVTNVKKRESSIEHIFPQTPTLENWGGSFGTYLDEGNSCRHRLIGTLGNLLLVNVAVNASFSNNSFAKKKGGPNVNERCYHNGFFSEAEVSDYEDWTPETIKNRGIHLLDFMEEHWGISFGEGKAGIDAKLEALGLSFMA